MDNASKQAHGCNDILMLVVSCTKSLTEREYAVYATEDKIE